MTAVRNMNQMRKVDFILNQTKYGIVIEIEEFAVYLGMDIEEDRDLLFIAKEALKAPVPQGWTTKKTKNDEVIFVNQLTGEKSIAHPSDAMYKKRYLEMKALKNRTNGRREEQKHLKQLHIQQKFLTHNQSTAQLNITTNNTMIHIGETSSAMSLNYSNNNPGDHSLVMNQYNRGNDSTVMNASPVLYSIKTPISESKNIAQELSPVEILDHFEDHQNHSDFYAKSKCMFDNLNNMDWDEDDEAFDELNAATSIFEQDEAMTQPLEKENNLEDHISYNQNEESLDLSEFALELDLKPKCNQTSTQRSMEWNQVQKPGANSERRTNRQQNRYQLGETQHLLSTQIDLECEFAKIDQEFEDKVRLMQQENSKAFERLSTLR